MCCLSEQYQLSVNCLFIIWSYKKTNKLFCQHPVLEITLSDLLIAIPLDPRVKNKWLPIWLRCEKIDTSCYHIYPKYWDTLMPYHSDPKLWTSLFMSSHLGFGDKLFFSQASVYLSVTLVSAPELENRLSYLQEFSYKYQWTLEDVQSPRTITLAFILFE